MQEKENNMIIYLQSKFSDSNASGFDFLHFLTDVEFTLGVGVFMFLATDSLISFKTTLTYCFGLYIMVFLKMIYQSARPFWVAGKIEIFDKECMFDFASPSSHVFNLIFFWIYTIMMNF